MQRQDGHDGQPKQASTTAMRNKIILQENRDLIKIRFRDESLMMRSGALLGIDPHQPNIFRIKFEGNIISRPKNGVFLAGGSDEPFTPSLSYWWSTTRLTMTQKVADFLDVGASVLSKAEFSGSSSASKIRSICGFVNKYIKYDLGFSERWMVTFDDIVSERKGCCLQYAFLVSAILCEGGYRPKLVGCIPKEGPGHIWLEVNMLDLNGDIETFVVDAAGSVFVSTSGEVYRESYYYNYTFREYYNNADRVYYDIN